MVESQTSLPYLKCCPKFSILATLLLPVFALWYIRLDLSFSFSIISLPIIFSSCKTGNVSSNAYYQALLFCNRDPLEHTVRYYQKRTKFAQSPFPLLFSSLTPQTQSIACRYTNPSACSWQKKCHQLRLAIW